MDPRERFEALYLAYAGRVRAFARRRTTAYDADDVVAEVFLAAWRRLDDVPPAPLPWLLGVARGVLANRRRAMARGGALRERLINEEMASVGERVEPCAPGDRQRGGL